MIKRFWNWVYALAWAIAAFVAFSDIMNRYGFGLAFISSTIAVWAFFEMAKMYLDETRRDP